MPIPDKAKHWLLSLQTSNAGDRHYAVAILSEIGPPAERALPALIVACQDLDEESGTSANAAVAIRRLAPPRVTLPILINCLSDPRPIPVGFSAFSLLDLSDDVDCSEAIPALRAALGTKDEYAWLEVARALSKIDPEHSASLLLPGVMKILSEPATQPHRLSKRLVQSFTLQVAANLGSRAKECLPQIIALTNAPDNLVSNAAVRAINRIESGTNSNTIEQTNHPAETK